MKQGEDLPAIRKGPGWHFSLKPRAAAGSETSFAMETGREGPISTQTPSWESQPININGHNQLVLLVMPCKLRSFSLE